ncbi:MarR family transcriptional regulator [Candidatus Micrarchaeota archaeon]|nr:MarR family transcriptional regulator [Candidatus Micrarchaeota archaeon]
MKGPNPFQIYEIDPENIIGRKDEVRIFNTFVNGAVSGQPGILMITGGPGTGKTTLIRHFSHIARKEGALAPYVKIEKGEGMEAMVDKLYQETRAIPNLEIRRNTPESFGELLETASSPRHFGTILFVDDIDRMKKAKEAIEIIEKAAEQGISVVMTSTKEMKSERAMVLQPFAEHEAREVVEKALEKELRMGEECFSSIMNDSEGNPRLFKTVCHHIYDRLRENEKVISKGHYLAYLPHIMNMLGREWFGKMYQETPVAERRILLSISRRDFIHVSDIANELKIPLGPVTALVKRLLDRGQITKIERGRYKVFARLYGKYVISRS